LTQSRQPATDPDAAMSTLETETEDDEMESVDEDESASPNTPKPMNKKELKKTILKFGGIVLDEFPGPKQKIPEGVLLISDR